MCARIPNRSICKDLLLENRRKRLPPGRPIYDKAELYLLEQVKCVLPGEAR